MPLAVEELSQRSALGVKIRALTSARKKRPLEKDTA
jgi:hypothetical protein